MLKRTSFALFALKHQQQKIYVFIYLASFLFCPYIYGEKEAKEKRELLGEQDTKSYGNVGIFHLSNTSTYI
jgi:hypothetical protein